MKVWFTMLMKLKMIKNIKLVLSILILLNFSNLLMADNNFFEEGKKKFDKKKYNESKFFFQRSIVYNPKDSNSYLYLAKIYNLEENKKKEEKNIKTVLLLDPNNEEATYMLIQIELKRSNYSKVKDLTQIFSKICVKLCEKKIIILDSLKNLEPGNES